MSYELSFLLGADAIAPRAKRIAESGANYVVHVEKVLGFQELDADDYFHAKRLALAWLDFDNVRSAVIRPVKADGTVGRVEGKPLDFCDLWELQQPQV